MIIIGDIHGHTNRYEEIIKQEKCNESVQLGDFGFKDAHDWFLANIDCEKHKILFGNHDYYPYLNSAHSLGDYYFDEKRSIFYVRGAFSIDYKHRLIGINWFDDEEIPLIKHSHIFSAYCKARPKYVVSHDCPQLIRNLVFDIHERSLTSMLLEALFEQHQPYMWVFGHHHKSKNRIVRNTRFICLPEFGVIRI